MSRATQAGSVADSAGTTNTPNSSKSGGGDAPSRGPAGGGSRAPKETGGGGGGGERAPKGGGGGSGGGGGAGGDDAGEDLQGRKPARSRGGDSAALSTIGDILKGKGDDAEEAAPARNRRARDDREEPEEGSGAVRGMRKPAARADDADDDDQGEADPKPDDDSEDDDLDALAPTRINQDHSRPAKRGEQEEDQEDDLDPVARHVFGQIKGGPGANQEDDVDEAFGFLLPPDEPQEREASRGRPSRRTTEDEDDAGDEAAPPTEFLTAAELAANRREYPELSKHWDAIEAAQKAQAKAKPAERATERPRERRPDPAQEAQRHREFRETARQAARSLQRFAEAAVGEDEMLSLKYGPRGRPITREQKASHQELIEYAGRYQNAKYAATGKAISDEAALDQAFRHLNSKRGEQRAAKQERDRIGNSVQSRHRAIDLQPRSAAGGSGRRATGDEAATQVIRGVIGRR